MAKRTKVQGLSYGGTSLSGNLAGEKTAADSGRVSVSIGTPSPPPEAECAPAQGASVPAPTASTPNTSGSNSEAKAVLATLRALEGLERGAVERVLAAVVEECATRVLGGADAESATSDAGESAGESNDARLGQPDLPAFIAASGVTSDSWRGLMVAYWMTLVEGAEDFTPTDIERELGQIRQPIADIDEAFATILGHGFATGLPGKGSIERYMLTPEGISAVWQKFG